MSKHVFRAKFSPDGKTLSIVSGGSGSAALHETTMKAMLRLLANPSLHKPEWPEIIFEVDLE